MPRPWDPAAHSAKLGRHRWVVERTLAWFNGFRRLLVRSERRLDIAADLITFRQMQRFC